MHTGKQIRKQAKTNKTWQYYTMIYIVILRSKSDAYFLWYNIKVALNVYFSHLCNKKDKDEDILGFEFGSTGDRKSSLSFVYEIF